MKINNSDDLIVGIFKTGLLKMVNDANAVEIGVVSPVVNCKHPQKFRMDFKANVPVMPPRQTTVKMIPVKISHDQFLLGKCGDCGRVFFHHMPWHTVNRGVIDEKKINKGG